MSLKIGVLTFHRCINYGSYWQARCLVEGLRSRGYNATILDHDSRRVNLKEWKCAYRPVLPTSVPESDYKLYRKKIEQFFKAFEILPLSARFNVEDPCTMAEDYDLIVVGSDEVWNLSHPWYGRHPIFYGEGLPARHIISYAASFGNYHSASGLEHDWAQRLSNFDAISVRDYNSQYLVREAIDLPVPVVLDPCLQFPLPVDDTSIKPQPPYMAVYGHNFSQAFIEKIRHWSRYHNKRLISIGYRNDWADEQWIDAGPLQFIEFVRNADAVATNFFHGCVFALRLAKPFVCEVSPYRSNKIQDLLAKAGATDHLMGDESPQNLFSNRLNRPLQDAIRNRIDRLRISSDDFLTNAVDLQKLERA